MLAVMEDNSGIRSKDANAQLVTFKLVQDVKELAVVDALTFLQLFGMEFNAYATRDTKVLG